jgi:hypothetical protein
MSTQAKDQSIEGVAKDFSLSLGQDGVVYVTSATQTNGSFRAIQAVADTVFAALVARDWTGTTAGLALPAGTTIFGDFTSFTLTSGKVVAFGSADPAGGCADDVAQVLMTGENAIWFYGPRALSPIGYAPYGFETYQYRPNGNAGDEVVRYDGSAWIYENNGGIGEIVRVYSNQPRPWLVAWPGFTATKVCP